MAETSRARRVGFWLLVGVVATAFAEVPFPGTPFDLLALVLVVGPVYLLHGVVLSGVVVGRGGASLPSLYLAGCLLGLYEAYVTKVVWAPVGDPIPVRVAGVHWVETLSLVLFWHPLMALLVPIALLTAVATTSAPPLSGHRYARPLLVAGGLGVAAFAGALGAGPTATLVKTATAVAVVLGCIGTWRLTGGHRYSLTALLPTERELWGLGAALAALYLVLGATIRPDALPGRPLAHVVVLAMYVGLGGLWLASLGAGSDPRASSPDASPATALLAGAGFVAASVLAAVLLGPFATLVFVGYFVVSVLGGLGCLLVVFVVTVR